MSKHYLPTPLECGRNHGNTREINWNRHVGRGTENRELRFPLFQTGKTENFAKNKMILHRECTSKHRGIFEFLKI